MVFRRRRAAPEPSEEIRELVQNVARWIVREGGTSAFTKRQGSIVTTPFEGCRVEVCIAGDERQAFHVMYPTVVATIIFSLTVDGGSHYMETKWPTA
ncbi:MAG TPA: hypothetical protein VJM46_04435 [Candidatus Saccharimonadales bacterium]|nr:hypothetical protein [Candidatus Saccharimonadales bacterium]